MFQLIKRGSWITYFLWQYDSQVWCFRAPEQFPMIHCAVQNMAFGFLYGTEQSLPEVSMRAHYFSLRGVGCWCKLHSSMLPWRPAVDLSAQRTFMGHRGSRSGPLAGASSLRYSLKSRGRFGPLYKYLQNALSHTQTHVHIHFLKKILFIYF